MIEERGDYTRLEVMKEAVDATDLGGSWLTPRLLGDIVRRQGWWPLRDRPEALRLRSAIRRGKYDLVHVHHARDHLLTLEALGWKSDRVVASWHQMFATTPCRCRTSS